MSYTIRPHSANFKMGISDIVQFEQWLADHPNIIGVSFVGRSNVGKSSMINSLFGGKTARVSKTPGRTREINIFEFELNLNGLKSQLPICYLIDLPGYGFAHGGKEKMDKIREMIIWYLTESGTKPTLIVLIVDIKAGLTQFDKDMLNILREQNMNYIIVANKADKLNQKESSKQIAEIKYNANEDDIIPYSATDKVRPKLILDRILL